MKQLKVHAIVTVILVLLAWFIFGNEYPSKTERINLAWGLILINWLTALLLMNR